MQELDNSLFVSSQSSAKDLASRISVHAAIQCGRRTGCFVKVVLLRSRWAGPRFNETHKTRSAALLCELLLASGRHDPRLTDAILEAGHVLQQETVLSILVGPVCQAAASISPRGRSVAKTLAILQARNPGGRGEGFGGPVPRVAVAPLCHLPGTVSGRRGGRRRAPLRPNGQAGDGRATRAGDGGEFGLSVTRPVEQHRPSHASWASHSVQQASALLAWVENRFSPSRSVLASLLHVGEEEGAGADGGNGSRRRRRAPDWGLATGGSSHNRRHCRARRLGTDRPLRSSDNTPEECCRRSPRG